MNYGKNAYRSYESYLAKEKEIEDKKLQEQKQQAELKAKELENMKQLKLEYNNIESLKEEFSSAQISYEEIVKNCEAMEKVIKSFRKSKDLNPQVLYDLLGNLEKIKKKEKKARQKVDDLHKRIEVLNIRH